MRVAVDVGLRDQLPRLIGHGRERRLADQGRAFKYQTRLAPVALLRQIEIGMAVTVDIHRHLWQRRAEQLPALIGDGNETVLPDAGSHCS